MMAQKIKRCPLFSDEPENTIECPFYKNDEGSCGIKDPDKCIIYKLYTDYYTLNMMIKNKFF